MQKSEYQENIRRQRAVYRQKNRNIGMGAKSQEAESSGLYGFFRRKLL